MLQTCVSLSLGRPGHGAPLPEAGGLSQRLVRNLILVPPQQEALQGPGVQAVHDPQFPSTEIINSSARLNH